MSKKQHANKTTGVQWPAEWGANAGWPAHDDVSPDGRTFGQLDAELRKKGTSLAERIEKMKGGK